MTAHDRAILYPPDSAWTFRPPHPRMRCVGMSLAIVLLTFSAANALLPQLSSLAPTPVSPRVAAARLVAAEPPPLQQKPGAAVAVAARNPDGLLQSRRPLSRKQLKEPAFQWLNKELQWVAQDFLLMVEEESMGFLTVQEERELLQARCAPVRGRVRVRVRVSSQGKGKWVWVSGQGWGRTAGGAQPAAGASASALSATRCALLRTLPRTRSARPAQPQPSALNP